MRAQRAIHVARAGGFEHPDRLVALYPVEPVKVGFDLVEIFGEQVQHHAALFNDSVNLRWMPPKPPLLMMTM